MNKIVTVNIGGIAITIEEDAFDALRDYLKHISNHFKDTENGDEIIADIEHRIGEMLSAKLSERKISIDVADVKEVAQVMGYPTDFDDSKAEAVDESQGETTTENTTTTENEQGKQTETTKARRKLYRDPENKHLGGVIGGLAVYFDLDATILRILWLIAFFAFGLSFWVYIILWAVIPEAKTASERLEMRGESPTVESIKKNIHEEAKAAYDRVTSPETQKSVSRFTDKVVHLVTSILGVAFRFVGVFAILAIGFALVGLLIGLFTTTSGLVIGQDFFSADALHFATTSSPGWILRIAGYLIVALPLVYVAILILPSLMDVNKPSKSVRQGLISTWIIAVLVAIGSILFSSQQFRSRGSVQRTETINLASDTIIVKVDADRLTDYAIASRYVELDIIQNEGDLCQLSIYKSALGKNNDRARESTSLIQDGYRMVNNTLVIHERVLITNPDEVHVPRLKLTLRLPVGKTVLFHSNSGEIISDIKNIQNIWDPEMAGKAFEMTDAGLICLDCSPTPKGKTESFITVEAEDALRIELLHGEDFAVDIPEHDGKPIARYDIRSGVLHIERQIQPPKDFSRPIRVQCPSITKIDLEELCFLKADLKNNQQEYLEIDGDAAAKFVIEGIKSEKVSVNLDAASSAELSGEVNILFVDLEATSKLESTSLKAQTVNVEMDAATKANVWAEEEIDGKISSASKLKYRGSAENKVKTDLSSSVTRMD